MSTMTDMWAEVEPILRHKACARLNSDPQILFDHDGGPVGIKADVILARLIGFEDEIVQDAVRLSSVLPVYRVPISSRASLRLDADETFPSATPRVAEYVLQSGYVVVPLAAEYAPPGVRVGPSFTIQVLYLRYRRRK